MIIEPALIECTFLKRYKRFLTDVRLADGTELTVHCPNSGSMKHCQPAGGRAWISDSHVPGKPPPKRKLRYTLEVIEVDGSLICVNTQRPNALVDEALRAGRIPGFDGFEVRREVKFGESRLDFQLTGPPPEGAQVWLEVKNATMGVGGGVTRFPDAKTSRGTRHVRELMAAVEAGHRAVLFFCVGRDDTQVVQPADDIDPVYGATVREAVAAGVEVRAHRVEITPAQSRLTMTAAVPVDLTPWV